MDDPTIRCPWCEGSDLERGYHDREWGVPAADERTLFEFVTLEGAQAGLAWRTVLAKRDGYREAFAGFDWTKVARYDARRVERLLANPGIVRHRGKIESTIANARAIVELHRGGRTLGALAWSVVGGRPRSPRRRGPGSVPARTADSDALAQLLRAHGFRFVGSTTCYAFMQACGLVNDHVVGCFRHAGCEALGAAFAMPGVDGAAPEPGLGGEARRGVGSRPRPRTSAPSRPAAARSASGSRAARARRGSAP